MDVITSLLLGSAVYLSVVLIQWALNRRKNHTLFKRYGIPGPEPRFLSGNLKDLRGGRIPIEAVSGWLKKYGDIFGYYEGGLPTVVVKDLDLLKQVFIKDFFAFTNRPKMVLEAWPFTKTILYVESKRWKEVRSILTPTFSSSKIKLMTQVVNKKVDITVDVVAKKAAANEMFDLYEVVQGLTLDVIADCALAMKTHCQENSTDTFLNAARIFFKFANNPALEYTIMFPFVATVMTFINNHLISGQMTTLIMEHLTNVTAIRRKTPDVKSIDLLQLMIDHSEQSSKSSGATMTNEEIIANAYLFLLAGFETTSTALAFTFYLLITHPEVQERLYLEIRDVQNSSYETIQGLQYLDQVFSESLRYYPPVTGLVSRRCEKEHHLGTVTIPEGATVMAPVWDIHHDPGLWPDPWKFNPDRFAPEVRSAIHPMAFLPFGAGPRNCVGARFAQLEAKLAIFKLIKSFRFETCDKTDVPLRLECPTVITTPANGVYLRAVPR